MDFIADPKNSEKFLVSSKTKENKLVFADLQIHSKYARATSKDISIESLEKYAFMKGLHLIGVGDFQHPLRRREIDEKLVEDENGILWSKEKKVGFLWQTEVSLMYSQDGKRRAVHLLIFAPNTETADKITEFLGSKGRLDYDGRPIFGMTSVELVSELKKISDKIEIIPAHCLLPNEKVICNLNVKTISEMEVGDKVLTHTGRYKEVKEVLIHPYNGKVYRIQPYYFREGINATSEHPFLAIKTIKNCSFVGGLCKPNSTAKGKHVCTKKHYKNYKPEWIPANKLEVNDVLLYPRIKEIRDIDSIKISSLVNNSEYRIKNNFIFPISGRQDKGIDDIIKITPEFCRLMGYYLAEGYINRKNNVLQFAFAKHEEDYINEVISLMKKCFGVEPTKRRERSGYELYFHSKILVEFFEKLFYKENEIKRAYSKKMPQWMLYLPLEKQVELFKGWWSGDTGVTSSEILAQQMKFICLRLGIVPSIYKKTKEEHNSKERFIENRLITASHDFYVLQNLTFFEDKFNLLEDDLFKKFKSKLQRRHGWIDGGYIYIPIKKIEFFDYEGDVYNLEVEDDNSFVTPSAAVHNCMTPWFGLFGSKSGFDSLKECFQEQVKHIYAVESGMSADPAMLWRFEEVASGKINVVSFSDAHSMWPWRIGREATIFDIPVLSYDNIIKAIRTGEGLKGTIETPPEYGKYHYDGHRNCDFSCSPEETKKLNGICPKCGKPLTIGVDYRVEEIAKYEKGFKPRNAKQFYKLVPLHELIALNFNVSMSSKKAWEIYNYLIEKFVSEFNILLNVSKESFLREKVDERLIELILKNRNGSIKIKPGYDGEYGVPQLGEKQATLF